ncbi:DUF2628 domain-containing protein [Chryseobacterium vrystaatense]|nr:DUF2628 domain-containing protein [Chryseobacterium vrystaatense]
MEEILKKENLNWNMSGYDEVWNDRFLFFQMNGAPNTKTFKQGLKKLPTLIMKLRILINFYALLSGFIYFFIKGMWKSAVAIIGLGIACFITCLFVPESFHSTLVISYIFFCGMRANYLYYRKEVLGKDDFNIFQGMRFF